jgi:uncharacterized protein (DUF697 family)
MNLRTHVRLLAPAALALAILAVPLAGSATAATAATSNTMATQSTGTLAAAARWQFVGWFPDPMGCVTVGFATLQPFDCRFNFPFGWSLYILV